MTTDPVPSDWTRGHVMLAVGAIVNSALYLCGVLAVALIFDQKIAMLLAIVAMGLTFLSYSGQFRYGWRGFSKAVSALSIIAGILAGVFLLKVL